MQDTLCRLRPLALAWSSLNQGVNQGTKDSLFFLSPSPSAFKVNLKKTNKKNPFFFLERLKEEDGLNDSRQTGPGDMGAKETWTTEGVQHGVWALLARG